MTDTASETTPVVVADGISKRFGGAIAVNGVSLSVAAGEIHAVVGENGAGKSTLMRILAGVLAADEGEVRIDGDVLAGGPRAALAAGVALVHQELSLFPELSVAENIVLGSTPTVAGFVKRKEMLRTAQAALDEVGIDIDLDEPISRLSVSLRQFVEIARAVALHPKVLILDEPTATLTPAETNELLSTLRRLADNGMAIIYISHRIPEVFQLCTAVTVLRDGRLIKTVAITDTTPGDIIESMVGRELALELDADHAPREPGDIVLSATGVVAPKVHGVDLEVRAGQIVGLGGLVGAGRTELIRAIIGADPRTGGTVSFTVNGRTRAIKDYQVAVRAGIGYVPEERRTDGLALSMSVSDNVALPNRASLATVGVLRGRRILAYVTRLADEVGLRPPRIQRDAGQFSGGNQQKVVIAKWLGRRPKLMVLDEPTRGVDVGAKAEIHRLVRGLAEEGAAVLFVSSDLPELLDLADIIHVVRDGRIVGTLPRAEADERAVMSLASGEKAVNR